jgi:hypothetical protein
MFHQKEFIMVNKKWLPHTITIAAFLVFAFLGLACGSSPSYSSGSSYSGGGSSSGSSSYYNTAVNSYSESSESGLVYTFYNESSEYVTISDDTGTQTIPPGESFIARFNSEASLYNILYSPIDLVGVRQSGTSFTFYDK